VNEVAELSEEEGRRLDEWYERTKPEQEGGSEDDEEKD